MLRRSDHGCLPRPENGCTVASRQSASQATQESPRSKQVRHSKDSVRRTLGPASTFSSDLNTLESRAHGLFLVCALTCDDLRRRVEFEGAGDRSVGRWLDGVGLDGLGVRVRPSAGCGLMLASLVNNGFQDWRASCCIVANCHGRVESLDCSLPSCLSSQCSFQVVGVWLLDVLEGRSLFWNW